MSDVTIRRLDEMDSIDGGAFRRAGAELEIECFGMNVFDLPPSAGEVYPEHTHDGDGQEEVYIALRGSGRIVLDGEEHPFDTETMVRVGPGVRRKLVAGEQGLRVLALGGMPGRLYERPAPWRKGGPDRA